MSLVDYEIGELPEGEKKEVSKDYDVKKGDIYGTEFTYFMPLDAYYIAGGDEGLAKKLWDAIKQSGDEPLYVKVTSEWDWLAFMFKIKTIFFAKRLQEGTAIWKLIIAIAALIWVIKEFLTVTYYIFVLKKPPPKEKLLEIPKELMIILFIILIIMILKRR